MIILIDAHADCKQTCTHLALACGSPRFIPCLIRASSEQYCWFMQRFTQFHTVSIDQVSVSCRSIPLHNAKPGHRSGLGLGLRREVRRVRGPVFLRIAKGFRDAERLVWYGVRHS